MALNRQIIVEKALEILNEEGLENVTLRTLASRLNVQAPTLYWHFKNKAALIHEMAETILRTEFSDIPGLASGESWQDWLTRIFNLLRKTLLSYKDGGRVVAGAHMSKTMAAISETAMQTLHTAGVDLREARLIVLTATHYTFGYVIENQVTLPAELVERFDLQQFRLEHPAMTTAIEQYFASGRTVDDLYNDGLSIIIGTRR